MKTLFVTRKKKVFRETFKVCGKELCSFCAAHFVSGVFIDECYDRVHLDFTFHFISRRLVAWHILCLAVLLLLNVPAVFIAEVALSVTQKLEGGLDPDVFGGHMPGGRGPECNVEHISSPCV